MVNVREAMTTDVYAQSEKTLLRVIDIENFKTIHDPYGHSLREEVLRKIAETSRISLTNYDEYIKYR